MGLCSFTFMWLGMRYKFRPLRIVSLTLFSITLVKLFATISAIYRQEEKLPLLLPGRAAAGGIIHVPTS